MTEQHKKQLDKLLAERDAEKRAIRNQQKADDRVCKRLFDMTAKQVKDKLDTPPTDWWNEYQHCKDLIERFQRCGGHDADVNAFEQYVLQREGRLA